jgi:hypothetical protein
MNFRRILNRRGRVTRLIEGREVWEGKRAYFIASFTKEAVELDPDLVGADAVLRDDNSPDVISEFEAACSP